MSGTNQRSETDEARQIVGNRAKEAARKERSQILFASSTVPNLEPETMEAMWQAFCFRVSTEQLGYLIMEGERRQIYPSFAAAFTTLVRNGRSPSQALNDFYELSVRMA